MIAKLRKSSGPPGNREELADLTLCSWAIYIYIYGTSEQGGGGGEFFVGGENNARREG